MRRIKFQPLAIMAIGIVLLFAGVAYSQMSIDGQYNIAELMRTAQSAFDLDNQDAIFQKACRMAARWQDDRTGSSHNLDRHHVRG